MFMLTVFLVVFQLCIQMRVDACIAMIPSSTTSCADLNPAGCCPFSTADVGKNQWAANAPATRIGVPSGIDAYPSGTEIGTTTCGTDFTCLYSITTPAGTNDGVSSTPTFTCNCPDPTTCAVSSTGAMTGKNMGTPFDNNCVDCTSVACTSGTC